MKMKMAPALIALAIAAMGTSTAQAANDWYTGIGAGWAYGHDLNDFGKDADKDATALSLFGGYNFNDNFGAELGYLYAGKGGVDGVDFKTQGATLSGLARLPLGDIFSVFAEGGAYFNHVNGNGDSDNGTAPLAGLGLTAKLSDLVAEVEGELTVPVQIGEDPVLDAAQFRQQPVQGFPAQQLGQGFIHRGAHGGGAAADVEGGALVEPVLQHVAALGQAVLHVILGCLFPGKDQVQPGLQAIVAPAGQIFPVVPVRAGVARRGHRPGGRARRGSGAGRSPASRGRRA